MEAVLHIILVFYIVLYESKEGTIKLKNRTKGREEEEEEVVINGGSTFIFINININIIRRVGHIL